MAINLPANWATSTPKAFFDIFTLEGGQGKLPASPRLAGACAAAYALAQAALHLLEHEPGPALAFGAASALLLSGATAAVLAAYKRRDLVLQTIAALTATGVLVALVSIVLHFVLAAALPPPLPTQRLVNFLLFPIAGWNVFAFAFIYRHASLRLVPAFAFAAAYVIATYWILGVLIR